MANSPSARLRDPLVLTLLALAVIGWLAFFIMWAGSSSAQRAADARIAEIEAGRTELVAQLQAQTGASGTLDALQAEIARLGAERDQLATARAAAETETTAATAALEQQVSLLSARQAEREAADQELARLQGEAEASSAALAEAQARLTQNAAELSDVGARLEAARTEEATIRQTIAALTEEASVNAGEVADLEARLQGAREAEAEAQARIAEAQAAQTELEESRSLLEAGIADLEARRTALSEEVAGADQQRAELQAQIVALTETLAQRTADLANLERQIETAQASSSAIAAAGEAGVSPGRYLAALAGGRLLSARFDADGAFVLRRGAGSGAAGDTVSGRYRIENGVLVLDEAEGALGRARFPMRCAIVPAASGFTVSDDGEGCMLDGLAFERL